MTKSGLSAQEAIRRGEIIHAMQFATKQLLGDKHEHGAALARLGEAMAVDRVYVFRIQRSSGEAWQLFEWISPHPSSRLAATTQQQALWALLDDGRWPPQLEQGLAIAGCTRDMTASERATLEARGTLSLAVMPIHVDGSLWGSLIFEDTKRARQWTSLDLAALQVVSDVFGVGMTTRQFRQQLDVLAYYDELTGLPNRCLLLERAKHAQRRAKRFDHTLAVLLLDLDRFKVVNETLGQRYGSELLRQVGQRLKERLRGTDTVARLGGDEFVVLLEDQHIPQDAMISVNKLLDCLKPPFHLAGQALFITASIGISVYPNDAQKIDELLEHAEAAMYRAKARGRNCYDFYTAEFTATAQAQLKLETELRYALAREEFVIHYQPIITIASGRITGAEALVRWQHPQRGLITPGEFLDTAASCGLIGDISQWVLENACHQFAAWRADGLPLERLAVNLASAQIDSGRLVEVVDQALSCSGLNPQYLELEVTETLIIQNAEHAIDALARLKERGVSLAIDDFGTGYSSLSRLKRLPIHKLKIDRSFVRGVPDDVNDTAIARAIIVLAHSLGLSVTAEGVELPEQLSFFSAEGCDEIQGFLTGRPLPASAFVQLLSTSPPPTFST